MRQHVNSEPTAQVYAKILYNSFHFINYQLDPKKDPSGWGQNYSDLVGCRVCTRLMY